MRNTLSRRQLQGFVMRDGSNAMPNFASVLKQGLRKMTSSHGHFHRSFIGRRDRAAYACYINRDSQRTLAGNDLSRAHLPLYFTRPISTVFTRAEVKAVLSHLNHMNWLLASLLYGAGLRLKECLRLRVKDLDFQYRQILIREAKGGKDRKTKDLNTTMIYTHVLNRGGRGVKSA